MMNADRNQAEQERVDGITSSVRAAQLPASLAEAFIESGTPLVEAQKRILAKLGEKAGYEAWDGCAITCVPHDPAFVMRMSEKRIRAELSKHSPTEIKTILDAVSAHFANRQ